jgi:3-dehydroquinate synthase
MRGVRFGFVATTLLSQVDASVGGKNGVNLGGYKNLVGVFRQPEFVICDTGLLKTLPEKEIRCGLAEIAKHAAIGDTELFSFLEDHAEGELQRDIDILGRLIYDSVRIKTSIVNQDETEKGERRKLNFGHTLGHAVEKMTGMSHGEAVSVGMAAASELSVKKGYLSDEDAMRLENLLKRMGLPTHIRLDAKRLADTLKKDKKKTEERIHFVFLQGIGRAVVEELPIREVASLVGEWMESPMRAPAALHVGTSPCR